MKVEVSHSWGASLLLVACLGTGNVAQGDETYYRWSDERGNLVLSDRPPTNGTAYETVVISGNSFRTGRAAFGPGTDTPDPSSAERAAGVDTMITTPAAIDKDPAACEQAMRNLEALNNRPRIRVYDESGELRYLTPDEIEDEKRKSRLAIEIHCEQ